MKFGVREICDVVFKAKAPTKIGNKVFEAGQPVLYIDTAKTSTIEGAATTVYAQGGKGNTRLIAWEGEKTLTFTVEDALLSPIGFSVLSGAGLFKGALDDNNNEKTHVHVHMTTSTLVTENQAGTKGIVDLTSALGKNEQGVITKHICETAPLFVSGAESDGSVTGDKIAVTGGVSTGLLEIDKKYVGKPVVVDYYIIAGGSTISELQIDAENFAGYYYVEASTLFRREDTGKDMPAEITFPKIKIQSNFTFTMASEGDPSTFTFTMDAFPGYTYFDHSKEVLCVMQVIDEEIDRSADIDSVMKHKEGETEIDVDLTDSSNEAADSWLSNSNGRG